MNQPMFRFLALPRSSRGMLHILIGVRAIACMLELAVDRSNKFHFDRGHNERDTPERPSPITSLHSLSVECSIGLAVSCWAATAFRLREWNSSYTKAPKKSTMQAIAMIIPDKSITPPSAVIKGVATAAFRINRDIPSHTCAEFKG